MQRAPAPDDYITSADVARRLSLPRGRVDKMRLNGTGPRFARLGHRTVRYRVADVDAWAEARLQHSSNRSATQ